MTFVGRAKAPAHKGHIVSSALRFGGLRRRLTYGKLAVADIYEGILQPEYHYPNEYFVLV